MTEEPSSRRSIISVPVEEIDEGGPIRASLIPPAALSAPEAFLIPAAALSAPEAVRFPVRE